MTYYFPKIIRTDNGEDFADTAARILWEAFEKAGALLVTLPTGHTPLGIYKKLIEEHGRRQDIWQNLRYVALDEYTGLKAEDERLFQNWIAREILDPVGLPRENRKIFDSMAVNLAQEAAAMESWLGENGPIDIAVLGLGTNGHLAFNEPGSTFDSITRVVNLSGDTKESNAQYWGGIERVPDQAFTIGLGTIANAKQIFLLVSGAHKADILDKVLNSPITEDVPASILRTVPNVTIIADKAALGL